MTKNGSAVTEIEKTASAATAPPSAIARSRWRKQECEAVAGAHRLVVRRRRLPAGPQHERGDADDDERERVDREREPQQPGRAERAAEQRAGGEAERADGLHQPVGARGVASAARRGRHERELRRLADGDAEPEQRHQRQQRPQLVGARDHPGHHGRLRERDDDEHHAVLEAVDDRAREPGGEHDRAPQREDERRDRERGAGASAARAGSAGRRP